MVGGEALHDTPMAKTVTVRNGKTSATDGPYAETKEQMGGFYLINAESAEEAIDIAARIPGAATGHIEVREVIDFEAGSPH